VTVSLARQIKVLVRRKCNAIARFSYRRGVCLRVCVGLFVTLLYCVKTVQARITIFSLLAAAVTLVSKSAKFSQKFERGHPERGR